MKTFAFDKLKRNYFYNNNNYYNNQNVKKVNRLLQIQNKLIAKISPAVYNNSSAKQSPLKSNYNSTKQQQQQQQQSVYYDLSDRISLGDLS